MSKILKEKKERKESPVSYQLRILGTTRNDLVATNINKLAMQKKTKQHLFVKNANVTLKTKTFQHVPAHIVYNKIN